MIDAISRTELMEKIKRNKGAWEKCANKKQIIDAVEYLIDSLPQLANMDCTDCMVSKPTRVWHDVTKSKPQTFDDVLIKTETGIVLIGKYNNGGWLVKTLCDGKIMNWLCTEKIVEWRLIE